ncbi:MAG: FKBP-type peptidyl-prolyl cis-trans isomerase [Verrucomicrobiae bacterium]|nr:FKBP-type peptidyl-prolyl cis-trans isomerase [Verrucomicrobiae bacterium]
MNWKSPIPPLLLIVTFSVAACGHRRQESAPPPAPVTQAPSPTAPAPHVGQKGVTPKGVKWEVLRVGSGASPKAWDQVKVHYHGYFPDGRVFDSSVERGEPIVFGLNQVIPGWTEGVQLMQEGAKYRFYIPWLQAYGLEGRPPTIPPKQDLMFDIELIQVMP